MSFSTRYVISPAEVVKNIPGGSRASVGYVVQALADRLVHVRSSGVVAGSLRETA